MNKLKAKISADGKTMTLIYDDKLAPLLKEGKATITRVSNIEPDPAGGWTATMLDGTKLGPYTLRQQALDAEIVYLEEKLFKCAPSQK